MARELAVDDGTLEKKLVSQGLNGRPGVRVLFQGGLEQLAADPTDEPSSRSRPATGSKTI